MGIGLARLVGSTLTRAVSKGHFIVHVRQYFFPVSLVIVILPSENTGTLRGGALVGIRRVELRFHDF